MKTPPPPRRKVAFVAYRFIRLGIITASLTLVTISGFYLAAMDRFLNSAPARALELGFRASPQPTQAYPVRQIETHTCGLHAICALYRSHGLDPWDHSLRGRLGLDLPTIPYTGEKTTGTLQPDMCRVLVQDGFRIEVPDLDQTRSTQAVLNHLSKGWKALALIRKPSNAGLHWILLQEGTEKQFERVDSEYDELQHEDAWDFVDLKAIQILLVSPHVSLESDAVKQGNRLGVKLMAESPLRLKKLADRNPPPTISSSMVLPPKKEGRTRVGN